jgi:multiple sugar transport system permease protein
MFAQAHLRSRIRAIANGRRLVIWPYLFLAPALVVMAVFLLYPTIRSVWLSFTDYDFLSSPAFIGADNYLEILASPQFHNSLLVTLYYVVGTTLVVIPSAFLLALGLRSIGRFQALFRAIFFAPVVLSTVIASVLFVSVFHPFGGVLKLLPLPFGLSDANWYRTPELVVPGLILFSAWKGMGIYLVIFLAALETLPDDVVEAARVDGASRAQTLRHVVIPLLRPIFLFAAVISLVYGFQNFAIVFTSTKGGPGDASEILPILVYESGFEFFRMGYASALAMVMFLIIAVLSLAQFRLFRSDATEALP